MKSKVYSPHPPGNRSEQNLHLVTPIILSSLISISALIFLSASRPRPLLYIFLLLAALAFFAVGFIRLYSQVTFLFKINRTQAIILLGSSIIIAITLSWNIFFLYYVNVSAIKGNIFRTVFINSHAPIYCIRQLPNSPLVVVPLILSLIFFIEIQRGHAFSSWTDREFKLKLFVFALLMITTATMKSGYDGIVSLVSHYAVFADDLKKFNGIAEILGQYTTLMDSLSIHNSHYPPGNLILFGLAREIGFIGGVKVLLVILSAMTIFPMEHLGRDLGIEPYGIRLALALFSITPGIIIYPAISMAPLFMFLTILSLQMFVSSANRKGYFKPIIFGFIFAILTLFSFMSAIVALFIVIFSALGVWYKCLNFGKLIIKLFVGILVFTIFYIIIFNLWGFNIVECFSIAVKNNVEFMGSTGYDDIISYLLRSTGNIIAYLFYSAGFIVSILATIQWLVSFSNLKNHSFLHLFIFSTGITIFLAGFSGLFFLETERLWIFFTPLLCLLAGIELKCFMEVEGKNALYPVVILALMLCYGEWIFTYGAH